MLRNDGHLVAQLGGLVRLSGAFIVSDEAIPPELVVVPVAGDCDRYTRSLASFDHEL
jgi:hypothetical protein